ncbi:hypothetical protein RHGRI_020922 [Rhododendron griersonianum]|uniref:Uncharacterized protein n=1 Tax=Rhododendron griersonianum TaxID=479676 RepID=A0AAV6JL72_9ERIC|nr:hypothetical protein RHGRI_020922 [Rhododendron griersonianum]
MRQWKQRLQRRLAGQNSAAASRRHRPRRLRTPTRLDQRSVPQGRHRRRLTCRLDFRKRRGTLRGGSAGEKTGDDLVGVSEGVDPPLGACVADKGGGVGEAMRDEVATGLMEAEERVDRRGSGGGRGGLCMDQTV